MNGATDNLKIFYSQPHTSVLFFHDGIEILADLWRSNIYENSLCFFSFSWNLSDKSVLFLKEKIAHLIGLVGEESVLSRVRLLINSPEEMRRAERCLPAKILVFFNNASFINEAQFFVGKSDDQVVDAVYNARAIGFKRHELASLVPDKMFIAYDWKYSDVDLSSLSPVIFLKNVKSNHIAHELNRARVGLMLSAEEGACYASLEYLLCGLPVVSTHASGGRDVYYTHDNSIVCDSTPEDVARSVHKALALLREGVFMRDQIRASALAQMQKFRAVLGEELGTCLRSFGIDIDSHALLAERIASTNKLWKFRNMRVRSLP